MTQPAQWRRFYAAIPGTLKPSTKPISSSSPKPARIQRGTGGRNRALPELEHFKDIKVGGAFASGIKGKPFPANPFFVVSPPLADETRQTMYKLFISDPRKWTPRALSDQFGISIARTEAILRLKSLEQSIVKRGEAIQTELVKGMESILDPIVIVCKDERRARRIEPVRENIVHATNPFTQLIDEENHITPEDAAQILDLEPFANIEKRLSIKASKIFMDGPPSSSTDPVKVIDNNPALGGKTDFMIVDTSKPESPTYLVRDKQGKLKTASPAQVYLKKNAKPKNFSM